MTGVLFIFQCLQTLIDRIRLQANSGLALFGRIFRERSYDRLFTDSPKICCKLNNILNKYSANEPARLMSSAVLASNKPFTSKVVFNLRKYLVVFDICDWSEGPEAQAPPWRSQAQEDFNRDPAELATQLRELKGTVETLFDIIANAATEDNKREAKSHRQEPDRQIYPEDSEGDPESILLANLLNAITTRSMAREAENSNQAQVPPDGNQGQVNGKEGNQEKGKEKRFTWLYPEKEPEFSLADPKEMSCQKG
uniref:Uncharacterized protein n=1 Tax=Romanomermis culicivorax TaxID=13658 RepID=A0A915J6F9_ROMCU